MPRFHFDISEDHNFIRDDEGQEFADVKAARKEAVETGASIARDAFMAGSSDHVVIDIREDDASLMKISITMDVETAPPEQIRTGATDADSGGRTGPAPAASAR